MGLRSKRVGYTEARKRRGAFYRDNWWALTLLSTCAFIWLIPAALFLPAPWRDYVIGATVAIVVLLSIFFAGTFTGAWNRWMGGVAEDNTSESLKRFKRQGYRIYENVPADGYDIDHVLVGVGGILALETKWSSMPLGVDWKRSDQMQRWLGVTQARSRRIRVVARRPVTPVLVVWGPAAHDLPEGLSEVGGVWVVIPRRGELDLEALLACDYTPDDVADITRRLDKYVATVTPIADRPPSTPRVNRAAS